MDHIEKAKEEIEGRWFKDHVATVYGTEGLQEIHWGKPGTNMYAIKFVLSGRELFITGDLGDAVYTLTCKSTIENLKGFDLHYFNGKLRAFSDDRWGFNEQIALKELDDLWEEYDMDNQSVYEELRSVIGGASSMMEFQQELQQIDALDSDDMELFWDLGQVLPRRLISYWCGLQMAIKQIEQAKQSA